MVFVPFLGDKNLNKNNLATCQSHVHWIEPQLSLYLKKSEKQRQSDHYRRFPYTHLLPNSVCI